MAQPPPPEEEEQFLTSIFPAPPPFYKHFTPANLAALQTAQQQLLPPTTSNHEPQTTTTTTSSSSKNPTPSSLFPTPLTPTHLLSLPAPLRSQLTYLIPPPAPPPSAEYRVFGKPTKLLADDDDAAAFAYIMQYVRSRLWNPETAQGVLPLWEYQQLYPRKSEGGGEDEGGQETQTLDRQTHLFRLVRSILLKHLELLGILATDPTAPSSSSPPEIILPTDPFNPTQPLYDKAKDKVLREILNLVMNMHALINEYRPHQARETLIALLEAQVERKKGEVEGVRRARERVASVLAGLRGVVAGGDGDGEGEGEGEGGADGSGVDGGEAKEERKGGMRGMWAVLEGV